MLLFLSGAEVAARRSRDQLHHSLAPAPPSVIYFKFQLIRQEHEVFRSFFLGDVRKILHFGWGLCQFSERSELIWQNPTKM